jgi:hypothetical protein
MVVADGMGARLAVSSGLLAISTSPTSVFSWKMNLRIGEKIARD